MKFLTDIFANLSWLVFVFGVFVLASVYLHWNLLEYRQTDAIVFAVYVALVVLVMLPLFVLESRLQVSGCFACFASLTESPGRR